MKIRIKKLVELPDVVHPLNIEVGFEKVFEPSKNFIFSKPEVGERFYTCYYWSTSPVTEILSENSFKTLNSIYEWEVINEE